MNQVEGETIGRKLDLIARLLAASLVQGKKQREQIKILSAAGLKPREIAELLGTTSNTVSVELSKMRRLGVVGGEK